VEEEDGQQEEKDRWEDEHTDI